MVCVSEKHHLTKNKEINFKDIENEQFIVLGNSYIHNKVFEDLCIKNDIVPKKIYHTNEIQTAKSLIASGLGIGIIINMAVSKRPEIKTISLSNPIAFYISLATKRDHYMTSKETSIREIIIHKNKLYYEK